MIVVAIMGVLAAVALPAFSTYLRRAKTVEAKEVLKQLYFRVAAYYVPEVAERGLAGAHWTSCTVPNADTGITPNETKQVANYSAATWQSLRFSLPPVYYRYEIDSLLGAACHVSAGTAPMYNLRARGDLDGDGVQSLFEITVGSSSNNELYRSVGFYIADEAE